MKKLVSILLAVMMIAAACAAYATATLTDGEVGGFTAYDSNNAANTAEGSKTNQDRSVNILKELVVFNASSSSVYAPLFTYTYTVTPATVSSLTVTDDTTDHASGSAVTASIVAGITTGLTVNGGTAGDATSAVGTLAFTNDTSLNASIAGATNTYNITLDFTNVRFPQAGVYRYKIAETLADSATYDRLGIVNGEDTRYLDVYVDGSGNIYGYVCVESNESVTTSTAKTNGFVAASGGQDSYYTYDLTLSKDVVNDSYAESNTAFPFTVIFNNGTVTGTFKITETAGTGSTGISPTAGTATWSGVARVKDGGAITYTGIPCGVDVDVYETNIASGATYTVSTSVNGGTAITDNNVTSTETAPTSAAAQTTRAAYESSKATVDTTPGTAVTTTQTVAITNTLSLISPTGIVMRYAPYLLMLAAGVALLIIFMVKRRKHTDED